MIKCVMWDCFNVLVPIDTQMFLDFLKRHRGNDRLPEDVFTGSGLEIIQNHDLGKIRDRDLYEGITELYQMNGISQEFFFIWLGHLLRPDRKMLAIRDGLIAKGVASALVSNMNGFYFSYLKKNFPEFLQGFDYMMVSCEEGVAKPDPEAWIRPLDFLGLKAEECLFIDDSLPNVEAASKLGIKGWFYNSTDSNWCSTGKLDEERGKLKDFLDTLWNEGILKPR